MSTAGRGRPAAELSGQAEALRALHVPGRPLVLPNVWDAATAAIVAAAGFPAVATSSAAVAESLGYRDGAPPNTGAPRSGGTPPDLMFGAIARIAAAVDVPVTADVERGYGLPPSELVERLIAAGASGCNIEDSATGPGTAAQRLLDAAEQARFISAMRGAADRLGVPLVINARIDVFLTDRGADQRPQVEEALRRGRRYRDAGANCLFPILASELEVISALVAGIDGPVNILCGRNDPADLAALGVARISFGAATFRDAMARFAEDVRGISERAAAARR